MLNIIASGQPEQMMKAGVESIINNIATPARIVGGILILASIGIMSIQIILSKKNEKRVEHMEGLLYICLASFILGAISLFLGFFNSIAK